MDNRRLTKKTPFELKREEKVKIELVNSSDSDEDIKRVKKELVKKSSSSDSDESSSSRSIIAFDLYRKNFK